MIAEYHIKRTKDNMQLEKRNQEYGKIILFYNQGTTEYQKAHRQEFERARWELTKSNQKLVSQLIKRFRGFLDLELLSEGMNAIYEKSEDWDYRIASIGAYAGSLIRRRIIKDYYKSRNKKRFSLTNKEPSTNPQDYPLERLMADEEIDINEKKLRDIMAIVNNGVLSAMEKYVMREHYIAGRQLTDLAQEHGLSRERISAHHRKALRKIQTALKPKYNEITVKQKPIVKKKRKK